VELSAVIALTAVVATLAYSVYRTHTVRAQIDDAIDATRALRESIVHAFRHHGEVPATAAGVPAFRGELSMPGSIESLTVRNGRIDLVFGGDADRAIAHQQLSLTPYETVDLEVHWICGNELPGAGLRPLGFAGGGRQAEQKAATIEPRYLRAKCR
jgi:type IV pilus assembly protein PilA